MRNPHYFKYFLLTVFLNIFVFAGTASVWHYALGDINKDTEHDVLDIILIVNQIIFGENQTPYEKWAADINEDDVITVQDIVYLISRIVNPLPCISQNRYCWFSLDECCADTTTNTFVWEIDTIGVPLDLNILHDAFIVNADDIWVVGEIIQPDEDGDGWPDRYNALHWNGTEWELITIIFPPYYLDGWMDSVFGFASDDLLVTGAIPAHYDGNSWFVPPHDVEDFPSPLSTIRHSWGTSTDNMYFGEDTGDIVHWDGNGFELMETGTGSGSGYETDIQIRDIWGISEDNIWAIAGHHAWITDDLPMTLLHFNGSEWETQYQLTTWEPNPNQLSNFFSDVWAFGDTLYVSTGWYGIWQESINTGEGEYMQAEQGFFDPDIIVGKGLRGNYYNDLYTVSWQGKYGHYNGVTWYYGLEVFNELEAMDIYQYKCHGLDARENTIILFGEINIGEKLWVARGERIE